MFRRILLLTLLGLLPSLLIAQKSLQEGSIVYSVRIGSGGTTTGSAEQAGTYTLTIKGPNVRKELRMNSGYRNVVLQNRSTKSVYTLQMAGGTPYAVQLDMDDLIERQKPYEGFNIRNEEGLITIAGQSCHKASVTYEDGTQTSIYYAIDWLSPDALLFDRFPGIRNIPMSFEYRNVEGISLFFEADKLEARPVESALFRVPAEYKIISNTEYKSLRK